MPLYYADSHVVGNVLDRESAEIGSLNAGIADVLAQYFIDTSTWGLAYWERVCGIKTDITKPYDQRRAVIKSKLRGMGTVTVSLIKNVAEAYDNGEVSVTEDNTSYTLTITFISRRGIPPALGDIQSSLREIVPAHLGINFKFTYLSWAELDAQRWTWSALNARAFTWRQLEVFKP